MPLGKAFETLQPSDRVEILKEVYKKHAAELLALEEAQQKLTLVLLGILAAGASRSSELRRTSC